MKQIFQSLKTGEILIEDIAVPKVKPGHVLIRTHASLISAGTERMMLEFGRAGWVSKAKQQPEKVKQVLDKVRADGLGPTLQSVKAKLDEPLAMGYCNVGVVLEVGEGVDEFQVGQRVASNGNHAEMVMVPRNLAARIPENVSDDEACFTVLGSIGLQGVRLLQPTLGETFAVFGLGLIGLLAVQILKAHGARVVGFDFDPERVEMARRFGAQAADLSQGTDPVAAAMSWTEELGVDGVLVTAATSSDELMHQAAEMCRKRGRIVLTGVTGLNLRRADFYEKELTFQVSCSYGPGRYDSAYENQGQDYPIGFVRWTEQRNFQAVLELLREKQLVTDGLISRRVPFADAKDAYDAVADRSVIGVMLTYPDGQLESGKQRPIARVIEHQPARQPAEKVVVGLIGAGGFAQRNILPALVKADARLKWVATSQGVSGSLAARRFPIEQSTTDVANVLDDPEVNTVVIATRHNTHATLVNRALEAGKAVFVEKPLCLTCDELGRVKETYEQKAQTADGSPLLMVGYNRRFAPLTQNLRQQLASRTRPLSMIFTCNAGAIPADHWVQDPEVGGGRILGEACHFIDLLHYLIGESPIVQVAALKHGADGASNLEDTVAITLRFQDGSLGQINYFANGSPSFPKERLEVFGENRVWQIDNFRRLQSFGGGGRGKRGWTQDKGHNAEFQAFVDAVRSGKPSPITFSSLVNTARATLAVVEACRGAKVVDVGSD